MQARPQYYADEYESLEQCIVDYPYVSKEVDDMPYILRLCELEKLASLQHLLELVDGLVHHLDL
jgi:hypothetical protein